jgi:hypothetical protein
LFKTPVGVVEPGRLVDVGRSQDGSGFDNGSYPNYLDIPRAQHGVHRHLRLQAGRGADEPRRQRRRRADLRRHGVDQLLRDPRRASEIGRLFASADGIQPGATPFAVLSHQFWKRRFNGDPASSADAAR